MGYKMKGFSGFKSSPAKQLPKDFNTKGSKGSTTPGYETTKAAKTQNFRNEANKIKTVSSKTNKSSKVVDAFKNASKQMQKPAKKVVKKKLVKKIAGKLLSRAIPGAGWGLAAYDVGKFATDWHKTGSAKKAWKKMWD